MSKKAKKKATVIYYPKVHRRPVEKPAAPVVYEPKVCA